MSNFISNVIDNSYNFLFHPINSAPANASGATKTLRTISALAIGIFTLGGAYLAVGLLSRSVKAYRDLHHDQAEKAKKIDDFVKSGGKFLDGLYIPPIRLSESTKGDRVRAVLDIVKNVHDQVNNAEQVRRYAGWIDMQLQDINNIANDKLAYDEKLRLYAGLHALLNDSKHYGKKSTEASRIISRVQDDLIKTLINYIIKGPVSSVMKPTPEDEKMALLMEIEELNKVLTFVLGEKVQAQVKAEVQQLNVSNKEVSKVHYRPERRAEYIAANQKRIADLNSVADSLKTYINKLQDQADRI